jgi:hypothetical protein
MQSSAVGLHTGHSLPTPDETKRVYSRDVSSPWWVMLILSPRDRGIALDTHPHQQNTKHYIKAVL